MEAHAVRVRIEAAGMDLGLSDRAIAAIVRSVLDSEPPAPPPRQPNAANSTLSDSEVREALADRDALLAQRQQVMDLLGTTNPARLMHDLRNVLNQVQLLKALTDTLESEDA